MILKSCSEVSFGGHQLREYEQGQCTIIGTILPAELDENNNVTDIGIETEDLKEYIVFMDRTGEELIPHLDRKVEATGTVKEMYGDLIITVERYHLL
jgi:hypothetical protein